MEATLKKNLLFWLIPLFLLALWYLKIIIFPFLVGIIIGSAIQSLAFYLSYKIKINYYFSVFLIYSLFIILIIITFYLIIKVLIEEVPQLLERIQSYVELMKNFNLKIKWTDFFSLSDYLLNVLYFLSNFFGSLSSLILIFIVSLYVSFDKKFPENIISYFHLKEDYLKIWRQIRRKISFWFLGQIILMLFIGLGTYIFVGLVLKIKYSLLISLLAGILEIVPILGSIITLIITVIIVFLDTPNYVLPVIIFFILLQQLENHILVPLVMKKALAINPLLVILGVLIGAKIAGILGIIIIIPLLGSILEILKVKNQGK